MAEPFTKPAVNKWLVAMTAMVPILSKASDWQGNGPSRL